jgi:hypothetical protein
MYAPPKPITTTPKKQQNPQTKKPTKPNPKNIPPALDKGSGRYEGGGRSGDEGVVG